MLGRACVRACVRACAFCMTPSFHLELAFSSAVAQWPVSHVACTFMAVHGCSWLCIAVHGCARQGMAVHSSRLVVVVVVRGEGRLIS